MIYKQFDFTAAILLNGGCEGQIKVICEIFDKFEIAIHLSIQWCQKNDSTYNTLSDIATLVNTAAIFKNGGCECRISPNIPYLKL